MRGAFITEVIRPNKTARSTCLQFQNGELIEDQETDLSCGLHCNDAQRVIPVLASDTLIYTGQVVEQNAYNTFIAIKNKKTNKMKLVAINEALLKPQPPKMRNILDSTMMETNKRALTDLNKEFGSKKTKRQTETLERLKVNVDNYKDQLEKTVANISMEEMDVDEPIQTSDILPYINKNAEVVADVYTLDKLIPTSVLKSLEQPAQDLMEAEEDAITTTSESIKSKIIEQQSSDDEEAPNNITTLLILDALMNIYSTPARNINTRGFHASEHSKALSEFIMDTFTVKTSRARTRPLTMKDKASCYIIILNLLLNKNKLRLNHLAIEMKLSLKKLHDLCSMLLLHVKGDTAFVQLPLPAPRVFTSKKKGRR